VGRDVSAKALFINENVEELETLNATIAGHSKRGGPTRLLPNQLADVVNVVALFLHRSIGSALEPTS